MAIISNSIQNNTSSGSSAPATSRTQTFRSGNSTIQLQEGQTIKGVVSDVHGNQITLSMEDGSSFTGKLPDANQYSIGQKAAFQITSLDNNTIYMKALSGAYLLGMEDTIEQALEEASLPKSDHNLEIVRSLLQNQQSISRDSIMAAIRLCARYSDASVDSVITMNRLHLPMSPETLKQFESYQKETHQLLYKMDQLTDSINEMLQSIGSRVPRLAPEVGSRLLELALQGSPSPEELALLENTAEEASPAETTAQGEALAVETQTEDAAGETLSELTEKSDVLSPEGEPGNLSPAAESETGNQAGPLSRMKQLFSNIAETVTGNTAEEAGEMAEKEPSLIREQAGSVLSPEARQQFASQLSEYPISEEMKNGIADGTVTARDFLTEIHRALPHMTTEQAGKLLASKEFQALVKEQFLSGWTLSPEALKEEGAMDALYNKMSGQFEELSHFGEKILGKDVFSQLSGQASDMGDNLSFMKLMNETFQYIQLPLKLQNQNAHGDLYVMTRKESLKKDPRNLKVLLHLDMDHLGALDIQISKEHTTVNTNFFVSSKEIKNLLDRNIELLRNALNEQGYALNAQLSLKEKDMDVVKDFIAADAPVGTITRYNFDLRA